MFPLVNFAEFCGEQDVVMYHCLVSILIEFDYSFLIIVNHFRVGASFYFLLRCCTGSLNSLTCELCISYAKSLPVWFYISFWNFLAWSHPFSRWCMCVPSADAFAATGSMLIFMMPASGLYDRLITAMRVVEMHDTEMCEQNQAKNVLFLKF